MIPDGLYVLAGEASRAQRPFTATDRPEMSDAGPG
jgi:hypothetical protein